MQGVRVLRLINGLDQGGAEESLRKLVQATNGRQIESIVVSLGAGGLLRADIERAGVQVVELGFSRVPRLDRLVSLLRLVREWQPDIIEGWMVHANVLAYFLRFAYPRARVIWNIRSSLSPTTEKLFTGALTRVSKLLSRRIRAIVYNSERAAQQHRNAGYAAWNARVIPNGFDMAALRGGAQRREAARRKFGLEENAFVVGHVGRWHEDKDYRTLFASFVKVRRRLPDAVLVLAGFGLDETNDELMEAIEAHDVARSVVTLGSVRPIAEIYPAFDVLALTSRREGFPNVLGEALASGVPCVATDVGGCREVIGDDVVFAVADAEGIANALVTLGTAPPAERAARAERERNRVADLYSLEALGKNYLDLYAKVMS